MGIEAAIIGAALVGAGASAYQGRQQQKSADKANEQAQRQAAAQASQAERDMNAANQKAPNAMAALDAAAQAGKGGASGTMLTGASGIDPALLQLGKSTLLGG